MNDLPEALYVDPEIAQLIREMAAAGLPDMTTLPIERARAQVAATNAPWNSPAVPLAEVRDLKIEGPRGSIGLRHYRPSDAPELPVIVYMHGGGWTVCSLDTHDRLMRLLAKETGAAVIGVEYRLAPENPYPAPLDDCLSAIRWAREQGRRFSLEPARMVLAGDSAGANLALASLLALRDLGEPLPRGGALFYGCYWSREDTASQLRLGDGAWQLSTAQMRWFWGHYLGDTPAGDALAEPMYADLRDLPPLFMSAAALDPLLDDSIELDARLEAAGALHDLRIYPGLIHAFMRMTSRCAAARRALEDAAGAIRRMLA